MNANKTFLLLMVAVLVLVMSACTHFLSQEESGVATHPVDFKDLKRHVTCTECHGAEDMLKGIDKPYKDFNHSEAYYRNHSYYAYVGNNGNMCTTCHTKAFCTDCHATNAALNPNSRNRDNIEFGFSHRGDYLTRHRYDGEMDPASCYKCHGRSNNELCRNCHK